MKNKQNIFLALAIASLTASIGLTANAQLFSYTGTSTENTSAMSSSSASSTSGSTGNYPPASLPTMPTITLPLPAGNWVQFDGLIVTAVTSNQAPAVIQAIDPGQMANGSAAAICLSFPDQTAASSIPTTCPAIASGTAYQIQINADTEVLLRNRTPGVIANITPGDQINAYGAYTPDGTLQATVVRDLSKPQIGIAPTTLPITTTTGLPAGLTALFPDLSNINISNYENLSGTITQVNSDGSFVVQLSNGQTFTVPNYMNYIHVGATLSFQQLINWINAKLSNWSQTTGLMIPYTGSTTTY